MTGSHSDALVFFGATGDLAYKKIFPALQAMSKRGNLDIPIVGVAKAGGTSISFAPARAKALKSTAASIARPSTACAGCCATWMATITTPRHFSNSASNLVPRSGRHTISLSRRRCSDW